MSKISVIMGVYNIKDNNSFKKAVNSILSQTYTNFEFIICDDGSSNNTLELLNNIKSWDERIKIIKNDENKGLAYTLNHCIKVASGVYLARMDDDDECRSDRFQKQVHFLESNDEYDIVGSNAIVFNEIGDEYELKLKEFPTKTSFLWGTQFVHPSVMIRKDAIMSVNGYRISKETRRSQDYDLFMRMYANESKGYNIQENLFRYRKNSTKKINFKYRYEEMIIRYKGFKEMNLLLVGFAFISKPLGAYIKDFIKK